METIPFSGVIHHLGMTVSGHDKKIEEMKTNDIEVLYSGVITTKGSSTTRYAYLDTIKQCGSISEFHRYNTERAPDAALQANHGIGCITGDVDRVKV